MHMRAPQEQKGAALLRLQNRSRQTLLESCAGQKPSTHSGRDGGSWCLYICTCSSVKQLAHDVMNIGRLVSFNWKLGLSTESSIVKGLGRAFVAVEVKVVDSGANIQVHSFDMTLAQLQNFAKQMKEMQEVVKENE